MQAIIQRVESRFGRFADLVDTPKVVILQAEALKLDVLQDLMSHRAMAVHVKGWYPREASIRLANLIAGGGAGSVRRWQVAGAKGLESTDVGVAAGLPYNMVSRRGQGGVSVEEYFSAAIPSMRLLRMPLGEESGPLLSPLDKLRLELDEIWPEGANISKTKDGRSFVHGLARIITGPTAAVRGFVHVDELAPLQTSSGLFSANVYLDMPSSGGELSIWPVGFWNRWDFYRHASTLSLLKMQDSHAQRKLRAVLPQPITIQPESGDLVLLCAQRPHAAEGFMVGTRVSMQAFITHQAGKSLKMDA